MVENLQDSFKTMGLSILLFNPNHPISLLENLETTWINNGHMKTIMGYGMIKVEEKKFMEGP
jgi:hypothetical protein